MDKTLNFCIKYWHWITSLILAAITILSLTPLPELPEFPGSDKTHHIIAYATLMMPVFLANKAIRFYLLLLFCLWGGAIELIQPQMNRYGEWLDFFANGLGLLAGGVLGTLLSRNLRS